MPFRLRRPEMRLGGTNLLGQTHLGSIFIINKNEPLRDPGWPWGQNVKEKGDPFEDGPCNWLKKAYNIKVYYQRGKPSRLETGWVGASSSITDSSCSPLFPTKKSDCMLG